MTMSKNLKILFEWNQALVGVVVSEVDVVVVVVEVEVVVVLKVVVIVEVVVDVVVEVVVEVVNFVVVVVESVLVLEIIKFSSISLPRISSFGIETGIFNKTFSKISLLSVTLSRFISAVAAITCGISPPTICWKILISNSKMFVSLNENFYLELMNLLLPSESKAFSTLWCHFANNCINRSDDFLEKIERISAWFWFL